MSEVIENSSVNPALVAGNTVASLQSANRDTIAGAETPVTDTPGAPEIPAGTATEPLAVETFTETPEDAAIDALDEENTFDVSRAEFSELQTAFIRLTDAIGRYNAGAPHKIA